MTQEDKGYIEVSVKFDIMPEIKAAIPSVLKWLLRTVFPKLEVKLVLLITAIVETILRDNKLRIKNEQDTIL